MMRTISDVRQRVLHVRDALCVYSQRHSTVHVHVRYVCVQKRFTHSDFPRGNAVLFSKDSGQNQL